MYGVEGFCCTLTALTWSSEISKLINNIPPSIMMEVKWLMSGPVSEHFVGVSEPSQWSTCLDFEASGLL